MDESQKNDLVFNIKKWLEIDNELLDLQKKSKELRKIKKVYNEKLVSMMKENEVDCFDTKNCKILYKQTKVKSALSKKHLLNALSKLYQDNETQAKEIVDYILNTREEKIRETIQKIKR